MAALTPRPLALLPLGLLAGCFTGVDMGTQRVAATGGTTGGASCSSQVCLEVAALIDGEAQLNIQGNNVWWQNLQFCPPGFQSGGTPATSLSFCGIDAGWCPIWIDPSAPDGGLDTCTIPVDAGPCELYGAATSDPFTGLNPPLPATAQTLTLTLNACRDSCTLLQNPAASNGYTAIVDLNDGPIDGSAVYDVTVCYSP